MITLKSAHEIELMRRAGKITAAARALARDMVRPGVTTQQIDKAVFQFITEQGATPSFLHYNGYPASVCVSVNDEIIHGIPGKRVLKEGDIVSVDVGAFIGGFHGDCAGTYPCGQVSDEAMRLIRVTQESFFQGIKYAREGYRLSDISAAVQAYVEANGFSVVRGVCRSRHRPADARVAGGAQLRQPRPWPPSSAGHDHRRGAHGQRRQRRHQADAGRLDCEDGGR